MKTNKTLAPASKNAPMLRISLHSDIVLPATADINALLRVLMDARKVETILCINDVDDGYIGESTHYLTGPVVPSIKPLTETMFDTVEEAQAARLENYNKEKAERAERDARRS